MQNVEAMAAHLFAVNSSHRLPRITWYSMKNTNNASQMAPLALH